MSRVALLGNSDLVIYNFRREIVERLIQDGHEVYILIPKLVHKEFFEGLGCKVFITPIDRRGTNPITDYKLYRLYIKLFKEIKPDIIYTYTIKCSVYGGMAAHKLHIPQIANITGLGSGAVRSRLFQLIYDNMYRIGVKHSVCTFYQNSANEEYCLKHGIVGKKHRLLPGSGVNLEHFELLPYPDDSEVHFLYVSRIMKEKGADEYLELAKAIHKDYPNTVFHVLGFCEEAYQDLLQKYSDEGIIVYHGMQDDMMAFQKISHCTIHPSFYAEGMSNVCLESSSAGRPVITTNNPGCYETVEHGVTGFVVPMKDTACLIETVRKFLDMSYEEKKQMGLAARKRMEEMFDRNIVVEAYMSESSEYINKR